MGASPANGARLPALFRLNHLLIPMSTPSSPAAAPREYWCFISYRHADNKEPGRQWATWLHQALETYEVPADLAGTRNQRGDVIPERIFPVFRDEEELPADARLSTPIEAALAASRFLVVLCSPQAVKSRFVSEEVLRFKQLGKQDRILAAIVEGEPTGGTNPERECFPDALRFALDSAGQLSTQEAEPIAADFRLPDGTPGWTSPKAFRDALKLAAVPEATANAQVAAYAKQQNLMLLKIVAGVLGVPLGVLTKRDKAYQLEKQRQRARVLRRWLAAISLLAVAAMASGVLAFRNWREAAAQRDRVAAKSRELSETLGISYFREGSARLRDERNALEGLAYLARAVREHQHAASANRLLTLLQQREIWIGEPAAGNPAPAPGPGQTPPLPVPPGLEPLTGKDEPGKFDLVERGPHGEIAVSWCEDTDSAQGSNHPGAGLHHFRVWDASGKPLGPWTHADFEAEHWVGNIRQMIFSPDGRWLAAVVERWRQPEYLQVWDFRQGIQLGETIQATGESPNYQGAQFSSVRFGALRTVGAMQHIPLIAASSRGDAYWLKIVQAPDGSDAYLDEAAVVPHRAAVRAALALPGTREVLVSASEDGEVRFTYPRSSRGGAPVPSLHLEKPVDAIDPDPSGGALLMAGGRSIRATPVPLLQLDLPAPASPTLTAEVDGDHQVRCFWAGKPDHLVFEQTFPEVITSARAQGNPASLVVASEDGTIRAFHLEGGKGRLFASGRGREVVLEPSGTANKVDLPGDLADLRPGALPGQVIATTTDRIYLILGGPGSRLMDEKLLFRPGEVPSACDCARLAPAGNVLLTRSQHWEPPNAMYSWTMLWDCASGEPLSDRIRWIDDGFQQATFDRSPFIDDRVANVEGMIRYRATPEMAPVLADLAELLSGQTLDGAGNLHPLAQSPNRAASLLGRLRELASTIRSP